MSGVTISVVEALEAAARETSQRYDESRLILLQGAEYIKTGQFDDVDGKRLLGIVNRLDKTQWALDTYMQGYTKKPIPFELPHGLRDLCSSARKTLAGGLGWAKTVFEHPPYEEAKRVAQSHLLCGVEEVSFSIERLARHAGFIAGAAVLTVATYAIWRSTQSESFKQYIVA